APDLEQPGADLDPTRIVGLASVEQRLLADDEEHAFGPFDLLEEIVDEVRAALAEQFGDRDVVDVAPGVDVPEAAFQHLAEREGLRIELAAGLAKRHYLPRSLAAKAAKSG